jgi:hypothetical protein
MAIRRSRTPLQRQADHDGQIAAFVARVEDPTTKLVAFSICRSVYRATACACEKRPDMEICSTMTMAALGAIAISRRDPPTRL